MSLESGINSLGESPEQYVDCFIDAAERFVTLAAAAEERQDDPGLGEWNVRDLVGHTSRALTTVVDYPFDAVGPVDIASAADYFRAARATDPATIAERGRQAGAGLREKLGEAVRERADAAIGKVAAADFDALVTLPTGVIPLAEYLPTRTFELAVHGCDLAAALGRPLDVPANASISALRLIAELLGGNGGSVIHALVGRASLPSGFDALGL